MADTNVLRQAYLAIEKLRQQVRELEGAAREPVAIIGYAGRFPGAQDAQGFWRMLDAGVNGVRAAPPERMEATEFYDAAGEPISRRAGLLDDVAGFDARFFAISPREAETLDPQHRLLLETSWHALEHAGLAASRLSGSSTGVFMGLSTHEYLGLLIAYTGFECFDAYFGTGTSPAAAAGRISHRLGLEGPAITIDTACSSSLVALHQAIGSLRQRECNLALAGGVNLILTPALMVAMSRARMLSPDGRCKTFDAGADGYVRGEGCGVLVLKRLSDALRDGDRIRAVIRGSAVNQDGASGGLTVPNGAAQQRVIRDALRSAGLEPGAIDYLEAHGTGTSLGDPIEVQAAGAVFAGRAEPLLIGSVKTNIGHLEAAAGVAGVIKVVLAMEHQRLPKHLHFGTPSPHIPWQRLPVEVVAENRPWPKGERVRRAGVSSFGFSGTNSHVVIEEAPPQPAGAAPSTGWQMLPISARTPEALQALAALYRERLREAPSLGDICHSAGVGRSHLEHRAGIVADSVAHAIAQLEALAEGRAVAYAGVSADPPKTAWLFTGQGSQYPGMGRELYKAEPVFRAVLDHCAGVLKDHLPRPLLDVMFEDGGTDIGHTAYAQPAIFALEMALARLWQHRGLEPDVVLGHSVGQYAAACVAGVFDLDDGLLLLAERGRLFGALPEGGRMAALFARPATVEAWLHDYPALSVAAYNGAHSVIAGPAADVQVVLEACRASGARGELLDTSHAFHCALLDPALDAFEERARALAFRPVTRTLVCNRSGKVLPAQALMDAAYWRHHARQPVRFEESIVTLAAIGCKLLLEVGPQPVLIASSLRAWPEGRPAPAVVPTLRRDADDTRQLAEALAQLYVAGAQPDFARVGEHLARRRVDLPAYPFQRQYHWFRATRTRAAAPAAAPIPAAGTWQLLAPDEREPWLAEQLRAAIAQALHRPLQDVAADALFTHLGVDSLTAMELRGRLQAAIGAPVPLDVFLPHATIAALAGAIVRWWPESQASTGEPQLQPRAPGTPPVLSFAQEQLWFLAELMPASSVYNVAVCARIQGPLDQAALARALETIVARHEVLRSSFPTRQGEAQVLVQAPAPLALPVEEVSENRLDDILRREAGTPFSVAAGPLMRVRLLRLAPQRHVLTLAMHHIVTDAWSFGVLVRELAALYGAFSRGEPSPLAELPVQYGDHAIWQRRWLSGARLERLLDFWRTELAGVAPLMLPHDGAGSRAASPAARGRRLRFALGRERAAALRGLAERSGVGLFVPLLAAFSTVLHRYAGQDDFVVGTMTANRGRIETEGLIGLFVNAVPLRIRLGGDPTVRDLLARLKRSVLDARAHEEAPFDAIVGAVQKERDGSRNPLFQVQLLLQPSYTPPATNGWSVEVEEIDTHTAKRDLTLTLYDDDTLSGHLEYALDLFAPERIERLRRHLERLVDAMTADPDQRLSQLAMLTDAELRLHGRAPALPQAAGPTFLHQFAQAVRRAPDAPAIVALDARLSYAELDRASNRVANHLRASGVSAGAAVAMRVPRSSAMAVGLLGILKAGAVYVPVDTTYPAERIEHMLAAARVAHVWQGDADASDAPPDITPAPGELAYILYTSGSTGRPKGVEIGHAALADYTATLGPALGMTASDVVLHTASVSFSSSIRQMLVPLAAGACVAIAGDDERRDPLALWRYAAAVGACVLDLVPTVLRALADALAAQGPGAYRPRMLLSASEPLRHGLVAQVRAVLGEAIEWFNMYGQTETTGIVALHRVGPADADAQRVVPIGRPRAGVGLQVVDGAGQLLPAGVPGRLRIVGSALARGYLDDAELTRARFGGSSERYYEAGDVVRLAGNGELEFIGRGDGQVKVRGVRVEPGEVERVLLEHAGIADAAVIPSGRDGETVLVACYVPAAAPLPAGLLRAHLRTRLPDVMVPAAFVALESMPLTANGKLDRAALPVVAQEPAAEATLDAVAPRPGVEQDLAALWQDLLRVAQVGAHDNFFALGGHSLLAAQLRSRIEQRWPIELPLATIFEEPTVAALAARIEALVALAAIARAPLVRADDGAAAPPLTLAQRNAWRAERAQPGSPAHWIDISLVIKGPLDIARQRAAIHAAIERHELLRTVYRADGDDAPKVEVLDAWRPALPLCELALPLDDFTLGAEPPLRFDLVRRAPGEHLLRLRCHRIVADGATVRMLLGEIGSLYANDVEGSELYPLLDTALRYADYAHWEARWLDAARRRDGVGHFRRVFAAAALPRARAQRVSLHGAQLKVTLPASVRQALDALARKHAATPVTVLAAAYARALGDSGTLAVCLALPVSRRHHAATRRMLGPFMNTLLLRIGLDGDPSFDATIEHTRQVLGDAMAHQDAPYEEVLAALRADHGPAAASLGAVALVMEDPGPQGSIQLGQLTLARTSPPHPVLRRELTLSVGADPDAFVLTFTYDPEVYALDTVQGLADAIEHSLTQTSIVHE